jgi:membrane protease YdiL (CAAX protease family)
MRPDRIRAVALAATLLGWSAVAPRIPLRWHPLPHAVVGTAAAVSARSALGLSPPEVVRGLRWGSAAAAAVAATVAGSTRVAPVRAGIAAGTLPDSTARWMLLRIPFGTVWSEETTYRAALGAAAARAFGASGGRWFTAAVFGLSHVPDARATGQSIPGTVLVTGAAGWIFAWLYDRSGSLAAPMLAHLAVNEAGAVAAVALRARD